MSVLAYIDESGDDGIINCSSPTFILSTLYIKIEDWDSNYELLKKYRTYLKEKYGIPIKQEFHTANFCTDKNPFRNYNLTVEQKKDIVFLYCKTIASLNGKVINTIIDKDRIVKKNDYPVLKNALTYTIQRLENDSDWKYIIIADKGRVSIMRKTARMLKCYNPISSKFSYKYYDVPIKNLVEDILEKDSDESYFIQVVDFISFMINLYYKYYLQKKEIPKRISSWLTLNEIREVVDIMKNVFNLKANPNNEFGFVIYPK